MRRFKGVTTNHQIIHVKTYILTPPVDNTAVLYLITKKGANLVPNAVVLRCCSFGLFFHMIVFILISVSSRISAFFIVAEQESCYLS